MVIFLQFFFSSEGGGKQFGEAYKQQARTFAFYQ